MTDDDETPRGWLRPKVRTAAHGVPTLDYEDPIDTGVFDLLDRETSDEENEIVRRTRRPSDAPLTVEDFAKLMRYVRRQAEKSEETGRRRQLAALQELLRRPPKEQADAIVEELGQLRARVTSMEPDVGTVRAIKTKLWAWLGVGSLATLTAIGLWLYRRGGDETAVQFRLQALETACHIHQVTP